MKLSILTIIFSILSLINQAQEPAFQTYSAKMLLIATMGSENHQWENNDIMVNLDYKTGAFRIDLKNNDFYNLKENNSATNDSITEDLKYTFKGILPIDQIINQKTSNQEYTIELQLVSENIDFSQEVNFKMNIMRTSQQSGSYRVFNLSGTLYNHELNLPAFRNYNNEVEMRVMFNAFWNN